MKTKSRQAITPIELDEEESLDDDPLASLNKRQTRELENYYLLSPEENNNYNEYA